MGWYRKGRGTIEEVPALRFFALLQNDNYLGIATPPLPDFHRDKLRGWLAMTVGKWGMTVRYLVKLRAGHCLCYYDGSMEINVSIEGKFAGCPKVSWLRSVAGEALKAEGADKRAELSLIITGQEKIHELNKAYLGEDRPTDVLSFAMLTGPDRKAFVTAPDGKKHLGEVIISYSQVVIQAEEHGHAVERELSVLIIHGVLHLLGYDHAKAAEKKKMQSRETAILDSLGEVPA